VLGAAVVGSSRTPARPELPTPDRAAGKAPGWASLQAERPARRRCLPTSRLERTKRFAARRSGSVAFAFLDECGRVVGMHRNRVYESASEVKAMLLAAYLRQDSVAGRDLTEDEHGLLAAMIELSDNDAADSVYSTVGAAGLLDLADDAGMRHFVPSPSWGGTGITAADQARFLAHVERFVPERHEGYALRLLARVIEGQRWGIPEVLPNDWSVHFKGGWYPVDGAGWRVNQAATLRRGPRNLGIAVLSDGDPSFEYGQETVRGVAKRLLVGY
jgi:beta-lactamase class A